MSEARLWRTMRDAVNHTGHWDRIESHAVSQGRPDVDCCVAGREAQIELKIYDPKRGGFVLRANQNSWMYNRVKAGGNVWILARYDFAEKPLYLLIPGNRSRALIHDRSFETWKENSAVIWESMPNWTDLLEIVLSGLEPWKASRSSATSWTSPTQ